MRSLPAFSDTRLSLSFFLTTPAKKPRTECCCQPVAFMIAAMVVPLGCRSNASTASCLDKTGGLLAAGFGFVRAGTTAVLRSAFAGDRRVRDRLVDFGLDFGVAI